MPATATEAEPTDRLDAEIASLTDRISDLEEDLEVLEKDKIGPLSQRAGRARVRGDRAEAERLDAKRAKAEDARESIREALKHARRRLNTLEDEKYSREARRRVAQLAAEIRDLADTEREAWAEALDLLYDALDALRTVGEARAEHAERVEEIRLLAGLFDLDEPDLPEPADGEELTEHLESARELKRNLVAEIGQIRAGGSADSLAASVSELLRHPNGRAETYRTARSVSGKISDATREAAARAVTSRLWDHFEAMDPDDQEGTISPSGDSS